MGRQEGFNRTLLGLFNDFPQGDSMALYRLARQALIANNYNEL